MAIFMIAVQETTPAPGFSKAIEQNFPNNYLRIGPGQFLIKADGLTTQAVSEKLGDNGENGKFAVFGVSSYWGYHDKNTWEWLAVKAAAT
jgi:hypothetical protein